MLGPLLRVESQQRRLRPLRYEGRFDLIGAEAGYPGGLFMRVVGEPNFSFCCNLPDYRRVPAHQRRGQIGAIISAGEPSAFPEVMTQRQVRGFEN